jgi:ribosomal protein L11 methyltransferase
VTAAKPAASFLRVQIDPKEQRVVGNFLSDAGCVAVDLRPGGELYAYAETDAELDAWSDRLALRFPDALAIERISLGEDWKVAWARALGPVQVSKTLRIAPLDPARAHAPPSAHQTTPSAPRTLWLEPAFAFGFGEHPTTAMLIEWLEGALDGTTGRTVLDFGSGTGVLGLAALCFGAQEVVGVDISPEAVIAATRNADINGFGARCRFSCEPLASLQRDFDVVVANVDATTLSQHARELATRMSERGRIALAGFLSEDAPRVQTALAQHGVVTKAICESDGWGVLVGETSRE